MRQFGRRIIAATVCLFSLSAATARAYPISPMTLWELVDEADLIVLARVERVTLAPPPAKDHSDLTWTRDRANLFIHEVWKGWPRATVEVGFLEGMICPAPPRYVEGERVLAFLERDPATKQWTTVGLSYGTLYPSSLDLPSFRSLVRQALSLQAAEPVEESAKIQWWVQTASSPGTRWHGLYELIPLVDEVHSFYDGSQDRLRRTSVLSTSQLNQIAKGFVDDPALDRSLPMVLAVLDHHPDAEVDRAAVAAVETLLALETPPWWIDEAMKWALYRFGDREAGARLKKIGEPYKSKDPAKLRQLWSEARVDLKLPLVPLLEMPTTTVRGVGENTPD